MAKISKDLLIKRYQKAKAIKENFRDLYDRAYAIACPNRNLYNDPSPGQRRNYKNYSSLGQQALDRFVNHMQSSLTPPFKRWAELKAGEGLSNELKEALNPMWADATRLGFELINASNFNVAAAESYTDLGIGTSAMIIRKGDDHTPILFSVVHPKNLIIFEDIYGRPAIIFIETKIEVSQIKETWPNVQLNAELQRKLASDPLCEVELIEVTYKAGNIYYYTVLEAATKDVIVENKMTRSGVVITRLGKIPGEPYGRGPVIIALEDLQMHNKAKELQIRNAQLSTFGMYTVADNEVVNPNNIVLSPGMFITVSRNGPNPSIAPLPGAGNLNMQQFMLGELQQDIRTIMMNDRLPPEIGPVRSATEYGIRNQSRQIDVQSYFGRLQYEFVEPIWENIVSIMYEEEMLPEELPPQFTSIDNLLLQVRVVSPLAKEQGIIDLQNTIQAIQTAQALAGPEAVNMAYRMEKLPEIIARDTGITAELLRSQEEIAQIQQQQKMAQQMQMQQEMMNAQQSV